MTTLCSMYVTSTLNWITKTFKQTTDPHKVPSISFWVLPFGIAIKTSDFQQGQTTHHMIYFCPSNKTPNPSQPSKLQSLHYVTTAPSVNSRKFSQYHMGFCWVCKKLLHYSEHFLLHGHYIYLQSLSFHHVTGKIFTYPPSETLVRCQAGYRACIVYTYRHTDTNTGVWQLIEC